MKGLTPHCNRRRKAARLNENVMLPEGIIQYGEVLGMLLGLLLLYGLLCLPGVIAFHFVRRLTRERSVFAKSLIHSALASVAFAPAMYGHVGVLPAIYVIFVPEPEFKLQAGISLAFVWLVSFAIIRYRNRPKSGNANAT